MQIIEKNINTGETIVRLNKEEIKILESLENDTTRFGIKIKAILKQRNMTQSELAKRLNVSQVALSQWVTGKTKPRTYNVADISNVLGISLEDLI